MSNTQLLEVLPKELKFIFELKKQSSCSVHLANNTDQHVAFKVKTTSPKKYCVRPNVGIIMPKSSCEFTVTMQAQKAAPPDMICKDKFLIQSTIVPFGTTEKDISAEMFAKDDGKYIEEIKLRVALISPPQSPVLSPINRVLNQGIVTEIPVQKDPVFSRFDILTPHNMVVQDVDVKMSKGEEFMAVKNEVKPKKIKVKDHEVDAVKNEMMPIKSEVVEEEFNVVNKEALKPKKVYNEEIDTAKKEEPMPMNVVVEDQLSKPAVVPEQKPNSDVLDSKDIMPSDNQELNPAKDSVDEKLPRPVKKAVNELKLVNDIEEMKSKVNLLETKLTQAESTISNLIEERRLSTLDRQSLQEELVVLRSRTRVKRVQAGFPLLYVVMVALVSMVLGYLSR